MKASYREAVEADIAVVADAMRKADKQEVDASGGFSPKEALQMSYGVSKPCYAAQFDDDVVALFGVAPVSPDIGIIWMLGTERVTAHPVTFMKSSRVVVPMLIRPYKMVCNIVDKRNTVHINWIKKMKFTFIRETSYGPYNLPFYEFARINNV